MSIMHFLLFLYRYINFILILVWVWMIFCVVWWIWGKYSHDDLGHLENQRLVMIIGESSLQKTQGLWWNMWEYILTSAHMLWDDQMIYVVEWQRVYPVLYDRDRDIALLTHTGGTQRVEWYFSPIHTGATVYAPVFRSGAVQWLTGTVTHIDAEISVYMGRGRIWLFSPVILTTLPTQVGDSGAPVFDARGNIVDVVHTAFEDTIRFEE